VGVAGADVLADVGLCLPPRNLTSPDLANGAPTVGQREPAPEGTEGTQDIVRMVMGGSPLARRVAVLQDSHPLVLQYHFVLVSVSDDGVSRRVGQVLDVCFGQVGYEYTSLVDSGEDLTPLNGRLL